MSYAYVSKDSNSLNREIDPSKLLISRMQLNSLMKAFSDRIIFESFYSESDLARFEKTFNFKFDKGTYNYFATIGAFSIGKFEVPDVDGNIQYTRDWLNTVATEDQKGKFVVVESDNGDYTLVDKLGIIWVYSKDKNDTIKLDENITTHLAKHIMEQIVGEEKY